MINSNIHAASPSSPNAALPPLPEPGAARGMASLPVFAGREGHIVPHHQEPQLSTTPASPLSLLYAGLVVFFVKMKC